MLLLLKELIPPPTDNWEKIGEKLKSKIIKLIFFFKIIIVGYGTKLHYEKLNTMLSIVSPILN